MLSDMMLESFVNTFIDKTKRYMFTQYRQKYLLQPSANSLWDWLMTQHTSTMDKSVVDENLHDRFVYMYNFMIKPTVKSNRFWMLALALCTMRYKK